jgi:hypothetical protein
VAGCARVDERSGETRCGRGEQSPGDAEDEER